MFSEIISQRLGILMQNYVLYARRQNTIQLLPSILRPTYLLEIKTGRMSLNWRLSRRGARQSRLEGLDGRGHNDSCRQLVPNPNSSRKETVVKGIDTPSWNTELTTVSSRILSVLWKSVVNVWNSLDDQSVTASSLNSFKNNLSRLYHTIPCLHVCIVHILEYGSLYGQLFRWSWRPCNLLVWPRPVSIR